MFSIISLKLVNTSAKIWQQYLHAETQVLTQKNLHGVIEVGAEERVLLVEQLRKQKELQGTLPLAVTSLLEYDGLRLCRY